MGCILSSHQSSCLLAQPPSTPPVSSQQRGLDSGCDGRYESGERDVERVMSVARPELLLHVCQNSLLNIKIVSVVDDFCILISSVSPHLKKSSRTSPKKPWLTSGIWKTSQMALSRQPWPSIPMLCSVSSATWYIISLYGTHIYIQHD